MCAWHCVAAAMRGAWIGETVQTWWKLAQGQQFNVNGIRMLATDEDIAQANQAMRLACPPVSAPCAL